MTPEEQARLLAAAEDDAATIEELMTERDALARELAEVRSELDVQARAAAERLQLVEQLTARIAALEQQGGGVAAAARWLRLRGGRNETKRP